MTPIIRVEKLHHTYQKEGDNPVRALRGIDLAIEEGEFVVILGHNGSGKSTLAKHFNALLQPTAGDVWVKQWNTKEPAHVRDIRRTVGMVFQHPDNQIVATIVEEDIAFGPENLGLPREEIRRRVDWSLARVDMQPYRFRAPHLLSGGQKQRVCIAGVLAMEPQVLVMDEATAMLDPVGREEVLSIAHRLNREQGVTVIAVTHFMREAITADRLIIMAEGQVVLQGPPREIFQHIDLLRSLQLDVPHVSELALALHRRFPAFPPDLLTPREIAEATSKLYRAAGVTPQAANHINANMAAERPLAGEPVISLQHLAHYYMRDTPLEVKAVSDVNIDVHPGEIVGILGHTGSGKSTAIQHFNGLLRPHEGKALVLGQDLSDPRVDI
ncbi:MAG: energy-coupling factor transporter ATPase, partial [Caldilineaceae bacterium]|nr:energy-coupling factor transporter ATPase [Caldilineaceae bacterium]